MIKIFIDDCDVIVYKPLSNGGYQSVRLNTYSCKHAVEYVQGYISNLIENGIAFKFAVI